MSAMQTLRSSILLLCAVVQIPAAAFDSIGFVGIWKFQKKQLIAKATTYTILMEDGSCSQASKVSVVGTTHWLTDQCTWSIEGATFTMKIVASSDQDLVGTSTTVRVESLSEKTFVYEKKGTLETWEREPTVPAEFAAQLPRPDEPRPSAPAAATTPRE